MYPEWVNEIKNQFNEVLRFSQGIDEINTDQLFETWWENKHNFIEKFNNKCIIETNEQVTFELSTEEQKQILNDFIEKIDKDYSSILGLFLHAQEDGIFKNLVVNDFEMVNPITKAVIDVIPKGLKIGKALTRYFTPIMGEVDIRKIQEELSRIIQLNKISGTLCLSVHPLDYLSISENNCKWRSCHALNGEYRSGNLNYMADDSTIIAYLKTNHDECLPRFPEAVMWNNKKWRCLFFCDKVHKTIWAGRQYPFFSKSALDIILQKFFIPSNYFDRGCFSHGTFWEHRVVKHFLTDNFIESFSTKVPYIFDCGKLTSLDEFIENAPDTFQYNDLLYSHCYLPYYLNYSHNVYLEHRERKFSVGKSCNCVSCGIKPIFLSDAMLCKKCALEVDNDSEDIVRCVSCGHRTYADPDYSFEGDYYCEDCYRELDVKQCAVCENLCAGIDTIYSEKFDGYVCNECAERLRLNED